MTSKVLKLVWAQSAVCRNQLKLAQKNPLLNFINFLSLLLNHRYLPISHGGNSYTTEISKLLPINQIQALAEWLSCSIQPTSLVPSQSARKNGPVNSFPNPSHLPSPPGRMRSYLLTITRRHQLPRSKMLFKLGFELLVLNRKCRMYRCIIYVWWINTDIKKWMLLVGSTCWINEKSQNIKIIFSQNDRGYFFLILPCIKTQ